MVAQAPDGRTGRLAGAAGIALVLVGLTLLLEPVSWRPAAAVLLALGLAVGAVVAMRRPPSGRSRTPMERLNDAAFLVVVAIVALIAVRLARPWTAALPGLVGGALLGLTLRPRLTRGPDPDRADPDPGRAGPDPGRAGTPAPGTEPPGGGE
jgi:membrane associated rhomboid family serine protease